MRFKALALGLAAVLGIGCTDQTPTSTADSALGTQPSFSSANGLETAGFVPFVSFGHGCNVVFLGPPVVVDGVLFLTFSNENIEVSREELFAGPATSVANAAIDQATGQFVSFDITFVHEPDAVNGTWEVALDDILLIGGTTPIKSYLSGVGTGDLAGLGIEYMGVINAKASATPPHIVCEGDSPFLIKGKIFQID